MAGPNAFMSNGTCYVSPGVEAASDFIPCGNDAYGHVHCCKAADKCLTKDACYDQEFGLTYLLGCTDPDYAHPECPDKAGFGDNGWVGLAWCNGTNDWIRCPQKSRPKTLEMPDQCSCDPKKPYSTALVAGSTIPDVGSLPATLGESIVYALPYMPTVTALPTATQKASTVDPATSPTAEAPAGGAPTTGPTPVATAGPTTGPTTGAPNTIVPNVNPDHANPTQTLIVTATADPGYSPPPTASALSTGAKAGIGAGAGAGGLALLAALIYFFLIGPRKRAQKRKDETNPEYAPVGGGTAYTDADAKNGETRYPYNPSTPGTIATSVVSELDSKGARPWSMRSELPGAGESPRSMATAFEDNRSGGDRRSADPRYVGAGFGSGNRNGLGVQGHGAGGQQAGQPKLNTWAELA